MRVRLGRIIVVVALVVPRLPVAPVPRQSLAPDVLTASVASGWTLAPGWLRAPVVPGLPGVPAAPVAPGLGFRWPLDGTPAVVRPFDPPPQPWLPGHRGVDLAAGAGAPVYAAGAGTVRFAGQVAGRGVVSVDHAGGLRTTYEPVTPAVAEGQAVR